MEEFNKILTILKENPNGYLATLEYDKPRVRPFGLILEEKGKLYFCTNSKKEVYKQLVLSPYIEYACTTKDFVTIRISGKIFFCEDYEMKEKVLNVYETVKAGYKSADNPIFKVFYLKHGCITISDFSSQVPKLIYF